MSDAAYNQRHMMPPSSGWKCVCCHYYICITLFPIYLHVVFNTFKHSRYNPYHSYQQFAATKCICVSFEPQNKQRRYLNGINRLISVMCFLSGGN
jgi:hypothetical protein